MAYVYDPSQKRSIRINSEEATAAGFQTCLPKKVPLYTTGECVSVNSKAYQAAGLKLRKEGSVFVERDNKWEEMCVSDKVKCCANQIPSPKTGACINSNGPSAQALNIKVEKVNDISYVAPQTSALWTTGDLPAATIFPETYVPGGKAKSMGTRLNPGKVAKSPRRRSVKGRRRSVKRPTLKKQTAALTDLLKKIDKFATDHLIDLPELNNAGDLDLELKDKALYIFETLKKKDFDFYNVRHLMFFRDIIKPKMMNVLYAVLYHKLLQFVSSWIQVEYYVYLDKALDIPAATMKKELENFMSWVIQSTILSGNSASLPKIKALSEIFEFKFSSYLEALTQAEEPINVIAGYAVESNIILPDGILLKRLDSAPDYNSKAQALANTIYTLMQDADQREFRAFLVEQNLLEQPEQPSLNTFPVISATAVTTERSVTPPKSPVVSSVVSPATSLQVSPASLATNPARVPTPQSSSASLATTVARAPTPQVSPARTATAEVSPPLLDVTKVRAASASLPVAARSQSLSSVRRGTPRRATSLPAATQQVEAETVLDPVQFAELAGAAAESEEPNYVDMLRFMLQYFKDEQSYSAAIAEAHEDSDAKSLIESIKQNIDEDKTYPQKQKKDKQGKMTARKVVDTFKKAKKVLSKQFEDVFKEFTTNSVDPSFDCHQYDKKEKICPKQTSCIWKMDEEKCYNKLHPSILDYLAQTRVKTRAQERAKSTLNPGSE